MVSFGQDSVQTLDDIPEPFRQFQHEAERDTGASPVRTVGTAERAVKSDDMLFMTLLMMLFRH